MMRFRQRSYVFASTCVMGLMAGCATERASVSYSYVVEPTRALPAGMSTLYIAPAKLGPTTDAKWSDMCATILRSLVSESRNSYGTPIDVTDRRDTQVTFDEADLAAAGMSTKSPGTGGKLLGAEGAILSNVDVKVSVDHGTQRTVSGLTLWGGGGHRWRHGGGDIRTREVDVVTRNMTVMMEFKLVDTANNKIWEHHMPKMYKATDRTKASPFFGSSQTEAALTPEDQIIATLVERGAREFISTMMPCRIDVDAEVVSSSNSNCAQGVKYLRAEMFDEAISMFQSALAKNPDDHRAAYGAGVAAEASGRFDDALRFYKRACAGQNNQTYIDARERVKAFGGRARTSR